MSQKGNMRKVDKYNLDVTMFLALFAMGDHTRVQ